MDRFRVEDGNVEGRCLASLFNIKWCGQADVRAIEREVVDVAHREWDLLELAALQVAIVHDDSSARLVT
jgi:hypothetical protein